MAFTKNYENQDGVTVNYWNIGAVQEDFKGQGTEVTVYGYVSEQHRRDGKNPPEARKFTLFGDEYVAGADRASLYAIIKQKPEFDGAQDA
jgi:hypothetical protein